MSQDNDMSGRRAAGLGRPVELLLYLYAESPVHAGASSSLDVVDLPIQRESTTGYPVIWGQSLKGALRQAAEDLVALAGQDGTPEAGWTDDDVTELFGSGVEAGTDGGRGETSAGLLAIGDAQLVALPVPTLRKTFAWVTSQLALGRLRRKYAALPEAHHRDFPRPAPRRGSPRLDTNFAASKDWAGGTGEHVLGPCVVPFAQQPSEELGACAANLAADALPSGGAFDYFRTKLTEDLLCVDDDAMPMLVKECTEQAVRVQLSGDKTVANGPFASEYLPTETILAASLTLRQMSGRHHKSDGPARLLSLLRALSHERLIQIGGDETLGKGLMWARLVGLGAGPDGEAAR